MRIAWVSNAPWCKTGYGVQTKQTVPGLVRDGHKVAVMANYGLAGTDMEFDGVPIMGSGYDMYSNDVAPNQIKSWLGNWKENPGTAITLYDVWVYNNEMWSDFPCASWVPIDHKLIPQGVKSWFKYDEEKKWAIAMSKFGQRELLNAGLKKENVLYVPHTVNTEVFNNANADRRRAETRKILGIPENAHVTIINSMNKGRTPVRKCFPEMLEAWCEFAKTRKDAYLFMHTDPEGLVNGVNLYEILAGLSWTSETRILCTPKQEYKNGITEEGMSNAYVAADVLLMTSRGEGFGVPAIEAQACGIPVILTDWTAQSELCGSGWLIDGQKEWDHLQYGWWKVPNVGQIVKALSQSYQARKNKRTINKMTKEAVRFASQYDTKIVYNKYWKPVLKDIENKVVRLG